MIKFGACLLLACFLAFAQTAPDVMAFFRTAAENLADDDFQEFMKHFDPAMDGYSTLKNDVEALLAARDAESVIEIIREDGDSQRRVLQLDWILTTGEKGARNAQRSTKRVVVRCTIEQKAERKSKAWKITALEPIDLFKP